ncbi:FAD-linked sulfhydryl oxidase ERV1 [Picochlorum sp. SENEW3]|nr:FAD-linked sulfhydryl oxidase ERV1 [Picochlorum sp. SENEW3]
MDEVVRHVSNGCLTLASRLDSVRRRGHAFLFDRNNKKVVDDVSSQWNGIGTGTGRWKGSRQAVSREEVGRASWTFLHTLAAQYPERPTRQQKRDARNLIDILTRMYPCGECARHFKEVVQAHPPEVDTREEFSQWMCRVHNVVNRSLGKPTFNCKYIASRWEGIECDTEDACSLDMGAKKR